MIRPKIGDEVIFNAWERRGNDKTERPERPWIGTVVGIERLRRFNVYEIKRDHDGNITRLTIDCIIGRVSE